MKTALRPSPSFRCDEVKPETGHSCWCVELPPVNRTGDWVKLGACDLRFDLDVDFSGSFVKVAKQLRAKPALCAERLGVVDVSCAFLASPFQAVLVIGNGLSREHSAC